MDATLDRHVTNPRWTATIFYLTDAGIVDVTHDLLELDEIDSLVESGPHWDTIDQIVIQRAGKLIPGLTVEGAEKL